MINRSQKIRSIYRIINENSLNSQVSIPHLIEDFKKENIELKAKEINYDNDKDISIAVDQLLMIIEGINISEIKNWKVLESEIKLVNFNVLQIFNIFMERFSIYFLTSKVYNLFKELLYKTTDIKTFKLAIIVTGMYKDNDLIEDYYIIAQIKQFTYLVFILLIRWEDSSVAKNTLIRILPYTKDILTIKLVNYLISDKDLIKNINIQREILYYGIKNTTNKSNIILKLMTKLNIEMLLKVYKDDKDFEAVINELFLAVFKNENNYKNTYYKNEFQADLINYFNFLCSKKVDGEILYGLNNLSNFINKSSFKDEYEFLSLKTKINKYYRKVFNLEIIRESLLDNRRFYEWSLFINKNRIGGFLDIFEKKVNKDPYNTLALLSLKKLGSKKQYEFMFNLLRDNYNFKERCYRDKLYEYDKSYETRETVAFKILISSLSKFQNEESLFYIQKSLDDFNPIIRLVSLNTLFSFSKSLYNEKIILLIKQRLADSPDIVRNKALRLCQLNKITLSLKELKKTIKLIEEREGTVSKEYSKELIKLLEKNENKAMVIKKENIELYAY